MPRRLVHPGLAWVIDRRPDRRHTLPGDAVCPGDAALGCHEPQCLARAAAMVRDVAIAMAAAHGESVIHRDLKPSNIVVTPDGTPGRHRLRTGAPPDDEPRPTELGHRPARDARLRVARTAPRRPGKDRSAVRHLRSRLSCSSTCSNAGHRRRPPVPAAPADPDEAPPFPSPRPLPRRGGPGPGAISSRPSPANPKTGTPAWPTWPPTSMPTWRVGREPRRPVRRAGERPPPCPRPCRSSAATHPLRFCRPRLLGAEGGPAPDRFSWTSAMTSGPACSTTITWKPTKARRPGWSREPRACRRRGATPARPGRTVHDRASRVARLRFGRLGLSGGHPPHHRRIPPGHRGPGPLCRQDRRGIDRPLLESTVLALRGLHAVAQSPRDAWAGRPITPTGENVSSKGWT